MTRQIAAARFALCLAAALPAMAAMAEDTLYEYGDWFARTAPAEAGQSARILCSAIQATPGQPGIRITQSNTHAGPPERFPAILIEDIAPRNALPALQANATLSLHIDDWHSGDHRIFARVDEAGIHSALAMIEHPHALPALQAMHRGASAEIRSQGAVVATISLAGFTAAYRSAMEQCGFSAVEVAP